MQNLRRTKTRTETTQQPPSATERAATDVVCPMYPPIDYIVDWAHWAEQTEGDDRPLILCEFSHAMGNSNGSLSAYVDAFFAEPALAGGFVWDWRDQGLAEADEQGRFYWAYGGHYGDEPNDANFNFQQFYNALSDKDFLIYPGKLTVADTFRIGCIGNLNQQDMTDTITAVKEVVSELNINVKN